MPQLSPMSWTIMFSLVIFLIKSFQMKKSMKKFSSNKKMKTMKTKWLW